MAMTWEEIASERMKEINRLRGIVRELNYMGEPQKVYVFIGMYGGLKEKVSVFRNFDNAKSEFEAFTETPWETFEENEKIFEGSDYEGSTIYEIELK